MRKHSKRSIKFFLPEFNATERIMDIYTLYIRNYNVAVNVIKRFGHLMKTIEVDFDFSQKENITEFSVLLNSICSDSLVDIKFETYFEDFFERMTKPFTKLEVLSITGSVQDLGSNTLSFSECLSAFVNSLMKLTFLVNWQIFSESKCDLLLLFAQF